MRYPFKLLIGDWSGDGHSLCDYFIVHSSHPVEKVVYAYIEMDKRLSISNLCRKCEEYQVKSFDIERLGAEGLGITARPSTKDLAHLICDAIMLDYPEIVLEIQEEEDIPLFCNWLAQEITKQPGKGVMALPGYGAHIL